ncbi:hypothetical protein GCM10010524_42330 [Streptomyces mexicanus]
MTLPAGGRVTAVAGSPRCPFDPGCPSGRLGCPSDRACLRLRYPCDGRLMRGVVDGIRRGRAGAPTPVLTWGSVAAVAARGALWRDRVLHDQKN